MQRAQRGKRSLQKGLKKKSEKKRKGGRSNHPINRNKCTGKCTQKRGKQQNGKQKYYEPGENERVEESGKLWLWPLTKREK